jgi:hypothetical protein
VSASKAQKARVAVVKAAGEKARAVAAERRGNAYRDAFVAMTSEHAEAVDLVRRLTLVIETGGYAGHVLDDARRFLSKLPAPSADCPGHRALKPKGGAT